MTREQVINQYFDWMYKLVCGKRYSRRVSYRKLLSKLYETEFSYILPLDANRAEDGIDLRYRFGYEFEYAGPVISTSLDDRGCSVLEMMIALSLRCEEHITCDSDAGDRTGQWFWNMIVSLGLGTMTDTNFDPRIVDEVIERFLNREYNFDGSGGLFTVPNKNYDMRTVDIWYQMMWYIDEVLKK